MQIDGLGSPGLPRAISAGSGAAAQTPSDKAALLLAIQQEEQKGGGGGGGHAAHGIKKTALDTIDQIAARASLNIESRKKTVADRMKEIEQLKAEMAESDDAGDENADDEDPTKDRSGQG